VSEKGAEKERKGMEKILINKQEMNAAASKEGSIIDIDRHWPYTQHCIRRKR